MGVGGVMKKALNKKIKRKVKHTHSWAYMGGVCQCSCGKYLQPDGKITSKP